MCACCIMVNWNLLAIIIVPDISMCRSNTCPLKDLCYRFTATPSTFRQAYADFKYDEVTGKCNYYWDNLEHKKNQERHGKNN